ncbi:hypothetical protein JXJ21_03205 [candidate division KSB1 bacterium]|nr:hypothetical protein [candidate division KSB1 bacterium]
MSDFDNVIDLIISDSESNRSADWNYANNIPIHQRINKKNNFSRVRWTEDEIKYLEENLPYLSIRNIAEKLGRSKDAIKIIAVRKGLIRPRYATGYLSCTKIASILGVDSHKPPTWVDVGILEGEAFPYDGELKRRVKLMAFKRFLIRPQSWVYFDVKKIRNYGLRRLVELAQEKWNDEWLTTRQAANLKNCDTKDITQQINMGRLYGYHAIGFDRVRHPKWAYWFIRKSDIENLKIPRRNTIEYHFWGGAGDEFLLKARFEGIEFQVISRMMKQPIHRIENRYWKLIRNGGETGRTKND